MGAGIPRRHRRRTRAFYAAGAGCQARARGTRGGGAPFPGRASPENAARPPLPPAPSESVPRLTWIKAATGPQAHHSRDTGTRRRRHGHPQHSSFL